MKVKSLKNFPEKRETIYNKPPTVDTIIGNSFWIGFNHAREIIGELDVELDEGKILDIIYAEQRKWVAKPGEIFPITNIAKALCQGDIMKEKE